MEQRVCEIALDSCVVIDLIRGNLSAGRLRSKLRGKPVHIVLCDVVLGEVRKIINLDVRSILSKISAILRKKVVVSSTDDTHKAAAGSITDRYAECHRGDNIILALCQARDYVLLTSDQKLLRTCRCEDVVAFSPKRMGGL